MSAEWYYVPPEKSEKVGPLDDATFHRLIVDGALADDTLTWRSGWPEWVPLGEWRKPPPIRNSSSSSSRAPEPSSVLPDGAELTLALAPIPSPVAVAPIAPEPLVSSAVELCQGCNQQRAIAVMFTVKSRRLCCDCKTTHDLKYNPKKRIRDPHEGWLGRHVMKVTVIALVLVAIRMGLATGFSFRAFSRSSGAISIPASCPFAVTNESAEPWAGKPPEQWPPIALANEATFRSHSTLSSGNTFLVHLKSGQVAALCAQSILGQVNPPMERKAIDREIVSWKLTPGTQDAAPMAVDRSLWILSNEYGVDAMALHVATPPNDLSAQPLKLRATRPKAGETIYILGASKIPGQRQSILRGKADAATRHGLYTFSGTLDQPADLTSFSGAPVLDSEGHLVAILTASFYIGDSESNGRVKNFTAEHVSALY